MKNTQENLSNSKISELFKTDKEAIKILQECTKEIKDSRLKLTCLQSKDKITAFSLLNYNSKIIHINDIIDKNPYTIINFFQGSWSPYCNSELKQLEKIKNELKILRTKIVSISPQTPDCTNRTKEENQLSFELLSDKNNTVAKNFGISFKLCEKLKTIYESFGIDLIQFNKNNTFELPIPAIFIINSKYEIIFSFIEEDSTKRCETRDILRAIKKDIINSN